MKFRLLALMASGGENGLFEFFFRSEFQYISGTYLKHKSPIDINFPYLLAGEHGKIE
jgi:hypothetical protein